MTESARFQRAEVMVTGAPPRAQFGGGVVEQPDDAQPATSRTKQRTRNDCFIDLKHSMVHARQEVMNVRLVREYRFEAAHRLTGVPAEHRCARLHGHSYKVEVTLEGPVDPRAGWLVDFSDIDAAWSLAKPQLDHSVLNDIPGLENPTCENLTQWIWDLLAPALPQLRKVTVWETSHARCEYEGDS